MVKYTYLPTHKDVGREDPCVERLSVLKKLQVYILL